ncbi:tetratricopeptide repeat protein [Desulfurobacterium sp.]
MRKVAVFLSTIALISSCVTQQKSITKLPKTVKKQNGNYLYYYMNFSITAKEGKKKEAEKYLEKALKARPNDTELKLTAAMFYASTGNLEKAIKTAKSIKANDEKSLRLLGKLFIMNGLDKQATSTFLKLTEKSDKPEDYIICGKLLIKQKRYKEAIRALKKGLRIAPENPLLNFLTGYSYYKLKQYKKAKKYLIKAARLNPEIDDAYQFLGKIYQKTHDKKIKMFFEKLCKNKNVPLSVLRELARIYIIDGEKEKAVKVLNKIVEKEPYNLQNLTQVATSLLNLREYNKVIPVIKRITTLNPDNPNVYFLLGVTYELTGQKKKAVKAYEKSLDLFPENTTVIEQLAILYLRLGKLEEAKAYFERLYQLTKKSDYALRISAIADKNGNTQEAYNFLKSVVISKKPEDPRIYFALAVYADKLGREYEAEKYLKKLLEKDPENPSALNYLAYLYANRGENLQEAFKMIKKALKKRPNNGAYIDTYGWILFKLGNYDKACTELQKAFRLSNGDAVVEEHLGECLYYKGDWENAKKHLENALKKMTENSESIKGEDNIKYRAEEILKRLE